MTASHAPVLLAEVVAALEPKSGQTLVIPTGIWHRGIVRLPGELLFITAGAGTEHRPVTL